MRRIVLRLALVTTFLWAAKYHPFLDAPRIIDDDARQHVYWTYRFQDPDLFRDDLLTAFMSSPKLDPPGYQALYAVGARLMDPLVFSQMVSLLLILIGLWLFVRITYQLGVGSSSAFAASLFVLYFFYSSAGGLPKTFAFPLLLGGVSLALQGSFGGLAGLLVVQSLFYPPILLNTLALTGVTWWQAWRRHQHNFPWRQLLISGLGCGGAAAVLVSVYVLSSSPSFGAQVTREQARSMAEFSAQGRSAFYSDTLWQTVLNDRWGIGAERLYGFGMILLMLYVIRRPAPLTIPRVVKDLVWTSGVLFGLAHLVLFKLHLPSRYVLYTFPLAALLMIAGHSPGTCAAVQRRWPTFAWQLDWLTAHQGRRWALLGLLAIGFVYVQNRYIAAADPLTVQVDRPALQLYAYLQTLPKDALIAGHPLEMDNIPLFSRRKVLVNQEVSLPYFTGYYQEVRRRLEDTFRTYYAADEAEIYRFIERYGVAYILVNRQHFTPAFLSNTIYYEPFNSLVKQQLSEQPHFALLDESVGERIYTSGPYILVSFVHVRKGHHGDATGRREHRHPSL